MPVHSWNKLSHTDAWYFKTDDSVSVSYNRLTGDRVSFSAYSGRVNYSTGVHSQ